MIKVYPVLSMFIFCKLTIMCDACGCDCDNLEFRVRGSIWLGGGSFL